MLVKFLVKSKNRIFFKKIKFFYFYANVRAMHNTMQDDFPLLCSIIGVCYNASMHMMPMQEFKNKYEKSFNN